MFAGLTRKQKPPPALSIASRVVVRSPEMTDSKGSNIANHKKVSAQTVSHAAKATSPVACATVRCQRENNEDSVRTLVNGNTVTAVLADGMGGLPEGEFASQDAANAASLAARAISAPSIDAVSKLVEIAGQAVARGAELKKIQLGYQTTFLAATLDSSTGQCAYVYCGDGEIYLRRARDQGLVKLIAAHHDEEGCLTSYLSPTGVVGEYSTGMVCLRPGDQLLLASDGLAIGNVPNLVAWLCDSVNQRGPELSPCEALQDALYELEAGVDAQGQLAAHDNCTVALLTMPKGMPS